MGTRQILTLALVAVIALAAAVVFRPHAPTARPDLAVEVGTTSAMTASNTGNLPTAPAPTDSDVGGSIQPKADEQIAPRVATQQKVHMKIIAPDSTSEFDVDLREGEDLCENIEEAKSEGHIRSLTVDDSYLATFGSRYVREINGYSNNWTVEVNGVGPKGCSFKEPKAGDIIVWEFGASGN